MNNPLIQLLVLAGIAVFLVLKLRNVLGTREGFESSDRPQQPVQTPPGTRHRNFEVIEGGPDRDITDHVDEGSEDAKALSTMKSLEPGFSVSEFLQGSRGAYEMIVMGFERGALEDIEPYMSEDIFESFTEVVEARKAQGLTVEAEFIGVREVRVSHASFDEDTNEAEIAVRFSAELTSAVRNEAGDIIEGSATEIKRQSDTWSFSRKMGSENPNWILVSTDA